MRAIKALVVGVLAYLVITVSVVTYAVTTYEPQPTPAPIEVSGEVLEQI